VFYMLAPWVQHPILVLHMLPNRLWFPLLCICYRLAVARLVMLARRYDVHTQLPAAG
jgi:hypothetical protein